MRKTKQIPTSMNVYTEKSSLPRFILLIFVLQFTLFGLYYLQNPEDKVLLYFSIFIFSIGLFLLYVELKIQLTKETIRYRMRPFRNHRIKWEELRSAKIMQTSAIAVFAGWGIRYSKTYGKGYITDAEYALYLQLKNGKKVTLSIKDRDQVEHFLSANSIPYLSAE